MKQTKNKDLARNLKNLRIKHKLTQKELANILGISRSSYAYYETSKNLPSILTLKRLADFYKIPLEDFFL